MKLRAQHLALLTPLLLTGCIFHKKQPQPVQVLAPVASTAPKPDTTHPVLPDSATTIPPQPISTEADTSLPVKPVSRHHHQPAKPPQQTANAPTPADPPAVSAIGNLSTGDPTDPRHWAEDSIASTDHDLNNIGRTLNSQEQKTAAQIREFLKQAKDALANGDIDGARTLAIKAKALLSELNQ
jgi:hypothetical protein